MRGLLLLGAILAALPVALTIPAIGVLLWAWVAFMSPHREVFGFVVEQQFNLYIAAVTLFGWLVSSQPKALPRQAVTTLHVLFAIWITVTTYFAIDSGWSYRHWDQTIKTLVLSIAIMGLITTKVRIQALVWVIAISLGYYAAKGAGFILLTGGQFKIFGPEASMIADNNNLGLALVMVMPLIDYLRQTTRYRAVAWPMAVLAVMSIITVIGTYSRGGFIALLSAGVIYWMRSRNRVAATLTALVLLLILPYVVPQDWYARMATIEGYEEDLSAQGRFAAWDTSWNLALDRPIVGGGFSATQMDPVFVKYNRYSSYDSGTAAHSIYFQVLGDHGFVGLGLFLALIVSAILNTFKVVQIAKGHPHLDWASRLARMIQVSFTGYLTAGIFLSMAYYDVFFALVAITAVLRKVCAESVTQPAPPVTASWITTPALPRAG